MSRAKWMVLMVFLISSAAYAADDEYKPYLHKAAVPEHPKAKLYGSYSTNLFPGAATYSYPIEVPRGTNGLSPSISISYNSQSMKQRSVLGAGWSLTSNYIHRDANFTLYNTTDDEFKLILNGASYDMVFDPADSFYHTEIGTFLRIENLTGGSNSYNQYFLVTLKDGTSLRFGYNSDSELTSNTGKDYALRWSLDQVEDTHKNKIFYSYLENPFTSDNGTSYISSITYNNDQKRRIEFSYEGSNRPDLRLVYDQGNKLQESRRLQDISMSYNETLLRRDNFEYLSLNNESSLNSLGKIRYFGSDNASVLHVITFGYYEASSIYHNSTSFDAPVYFTNNEGIDQAVRFIDINNDGYIDIIQSRQSPSEKKVWLNNRSNFSETAGYTIPEYFTDGSSFDNGLRIADLNNDGFSDLIQGNGGVRRAWIFNATSSIWDESIIWAPPSDASFVSGTIDQGVQLIDINGDGLIDILKAKESAAKKAYLNTGNGWKDASSNWIAPALFNRVEGQDFGMRMLELNGDGLIDAIDGHNYGDLVKAAWLNTGSGWEAHNISAPPDVFVSLSRADNGIRLIDLNGDGLTDILLDYKNSTSVERNAFINNGSGWSNSTYWISPEQFTLNGKNVGRRMADVDGDGFGDISISYNDGASSVKRTLVRNSTIPYLLKNITNEFGGVTYLDYSASTIFNNTGSDGLSDIGFNVWVVNTVKQNNSLLGDFGVLSNTFYNYLGGAYSYNDSEFRGFSNVNETLSDSSIVSHYFLQDKQLKGKEYKSEVYDSSKNLISKSENEFNFTRKGNSFIVNLISSSSYLYDGVVTHPKIVNSSYKYDNYSNVIQKVYLGDASVNGDEKYENYSYAINTTSWILDKPTWYVLFDAGYNKIKETKFFYDDKEYGALSSKGELTKKEDWLNTGGGNPTTRYRYDSYGNQIEQVDALGRITKTEFGLTDSTFTYPERTINALGHKTDFKYDIFGNVIEEKKNGITKYTEFDSTNRILKEIHPYDTADLPTKSYTYSFDGIAPEIIKVSQKTTSNNTIDTYFIYDGRANLVQIKSPSDNGQQIVKNLFYDGLNRIKEEQNPFFNTFSQNLSTATNQSNRTKYTYDALGRITSVVNPDGTYLNTTFNKSTIEDFNANGNRHTYILDAYDRVKEIREYNTDYYIGDNQTYNTTYSYDAKDELIGIRDTYGNNINLTIDSIGRKIKLVHPDLGTWNYEYDLTNNPVKRSNSKGSVLAQSYDSLNRVLQKNTTNQTISLSYDRQFQGTLTNVSYTSDIANFNNYSLVYFYDDKLRIIKEIVYEGNEVDTTTNTYDSMDRIIESLQPNNVELDNYYNAQNKIDKIKGYINQTRYNAAGNPLNRTYFNGKITTFDYNPTNLRLRQIKTDTIQQLNYSYDNVGNVVSINDSINNRSYKMGYDNLNRLTNVTINNFNWVYNYDAIGNILKIVRNYSQTTSFKYEGLAHAFTKVITKDTGIDVYRPSIYNGTNRTQYVQFYLVNEKNTSVSKVNYTVEFGDGSSTTGNNINLAFKGFNLVTVERNYSTGGNYKVNITGRSNTTATDLDSLKLIFGTLASDLTILKKNATTIIAEFDSYNSVNQQSNNWGWNCSNSLISTVLFNMSGSQGLMVIIEHNFTLNGGVNLTCRVNSTDGNQSLVLPFTFDGIKIENYNSTLTDIDTALVKFEVKNYFSTLSNIKWNITSNGLLYNGTISTLNQLQSSTVTQEVNFSRGGLKEVKLSIGVGNFTDTYIEYYNVKWLDLNQFFSTVKNATTRIFDFLITNRNSVNTTTQFNITEPALNYSLNLSNNESLIVVIEQDFSQGDKSVNIQIFNRTIQEDTLIEVFKIRHVAIDSLQTLYENTRSSIISAVVENNRAPMSVSWRLNNTEQLINSTQSVSLNTSEQMIVIIESNFTTSGIYPLQFVVNSSTFNDNATGVAVS